MPISGRAAQKTSVASLAVLSALPTPGLQDGEPAYVKDTRRYFYLDRTSAAPISGNVVAAQGGGQWIFSANARAALGVFDVEQFGAVAGQDSTRAFQDAADAVAVNSGGVLYVPPHASSFLLSDEITLPSDCFVYGLGETQQTVPTKSIFRATSASRITVRARLRGVPGIVPAITNYGLRFTSCADVRVEACEIRDVMGYAIFIEGGSNILCEANFLTSGFEAFVLRGVDGFQILGNEVLSPATPPATFVVPIHIDSTNGHAFGACANGIITNNIVRAFPGGQAISVDAGSRIAITSNVLDDVLLGISLELDSGTPGDAIDSVVIVGNDITCTSTGGSTHTNYGIDVEGASAAQTCTNVTVSGNKVRNANKINVGGLLVGGYFFQYTRGLIIEGNLATGCFGSSFGIGAGVKSISGRGNQAIDTQPGPGATQAGVLFVQGATGVDAATGSLEVLVNGASHAVEFDSGGVGDSSPDLLLEITPFAITGSFYTSINGGTVNGRRPYISGQTSPSAFGASIIQIANPGATTITHFLPQVGTIGLPGQRISVQALDANETIAHNADPGGLGNIILVAGVNLVMTENQVIDLLFDGVASTNWYQIA